MTSFIQNMLWNSVSGFVEEGKRTVGGYAGDALIKAGDLVEGGGRSVGNSIERKATGLGTSITGQPYKPSAKPLPSTARRPAAHRSNSLPANSKPGSSVPLGAKKYGAAGASTAKSGASGVAKTAGSAIVGAKSSAGGVGKGAGSFVGSTVGSISKPLGGPLSSAHKTFASPAPAPARKPTSALSTAANSSAKRNPLLPKPFSQSPASVVKPVALPKPYSSSNAFPSAAKEKKSAVRPGQSRPFAPPKTDEGGEKKAYPGTSTLPVQGGRTPVRPKKYKAAPRYEAPAKRGEVKHLAV